MKNFKLFALAFALITLFTMPTHAQNGRLHTTPLITAGQFIDLGGLPGAAGDSLTVSDTTAYIIPVTHNNVVFPYVTWEWVKVSSGTASVTLSLYQSNDNITYYPLKAGILQTTYTKAYTLSTSATNEVDFNRDTVAVGGRYLKLQWLTTATASVKGTLHARVKTNIK